MASAMYTDVRKKNGTSLFIRPQEGLFGLREWQAMGFVPEGMTAEQFQEQQDFGRKRAASIGPSHKPRLGPCRSSKARAASAWKDEDDDLEENSDLTESEAEETMSEYSDQSDDKTTSNKRSSSGSGYHHYREDSVHQKQCEEVLIDQKRKISYEDQPPKKRFAHMAPEVNSQAPTMMRSPFEDRLAALHEVATSPEPFKPSAVDRAVNLRSYMGIGSPPRLVDKRPPRLTVPHVLEEHLGDIPMIGGLSTGTPPLSGPVNLSPFHGSQLQLDNDTIARLQSLVGSSLPSPLGTTGTNSPYPFLRSPFMSGLASSPSPRMLAEGLATPGLLNLSTYDSALLMDWNFLQTPKDTQKRSPLYLPNEGGEQLLTSEQPGLGVKLEVPLSTAVLLREQSEQVGSELHPTRLERQLVTPEPSSPVGLSQELGMKNCAPEMVGAHGPSRMLAAAEALHPIPRGDETGVPGVHPAGFIGADLQSALALFASSSDPFARPDARLVTSTGLMDPGCSAALQQMSLASWERQIEFAEGYLLGKTHPLVGKCWVQLARAYHHRGEAKKAQQAMLRAWNICEAHADFSAQTTRRCREEFTYLLSRVQLQQPVGAALNH